MSPYGGIPDTGRREPQSATRLDLRLAPLKVSARVADPVLGEALFRDAFLRERKRADRFDTPFAVLLLDRGDRAAAGTAWPRSCVPWPR